MNGQVEWVNAMILQALKPRIFDRLDKFVGRCAGEVLAML